MKACNRHESKCKKKKQFIKHEFIGGNYKKHQSIFDKIFKLYNKKNKINKHETLNYFGLTEDDVFYPHEIAFDFEAILKNITTIDNNKKLQLTTDHVPVSVSILSNVDGFNTNPIFLCNESPEDLINDFVKTLKSISNKSVEILTTKYSKINDFLDILIEKCNNEEKLLNLNNLKQQFNNWFNVIPVLSFNGSKYDINLMKHYLHKALNNYGENVSFVIKKMSSYMSLKSEHL
jgi:hypothetical protein